MVAPFFGSWREGDLHDGDRTEDSLRRALCSYNLQWDSKNQKAVNCPAADKYISREYREG